MKNYMANPRPLPVGTATAGLGLTRERSIHKDAASQDRPTADGDSLGWDSQATITRGERALLPDGPAIGWVKRFERSRFQGSDRMAPCPMAVVTVDLATADALMGGGDFDDLDDGEKLVDLELTFPLNRRFTARIAAFFKSCEVLDHDATEVPMGLFNDIDGRPFVCETKQREWVGKDGSTHVSNGVARFLFGDEAHAVALAVAEASGKLGSSGDEPVYDDLGETF
jgi:hypothetical protein